jgi:hypothetical protein
MMQIPNHRTYSNEYDIAEKLMEHSEIFLVER